MFLGISYIVTTLGVGLLVHALNVRRDPEFRQALQDWAALRDPLGLACWRRHSRKMLQPIVAAFLWAAMWILTTKFIYWVST